MQLVKRRRKLKQQYTPSIGQEHYAPHFQEDVNSQPNGEFEEDVPAEPESELASKYTFKAPSFAAQNSESSTAKKQTANSVSRNRNQSLSRGPGSSFTHRHHMVSRRKTPLSSRFLLRITTASTCISI